MQAATTLSTSSAEPPTLREALGGGVQEGNQGHLGSCGEGGHELALLVQDEGGGHRRVAGQVQHLQCSLDHHGHLGDLDPHPEVATDLPGLVLHQGDVELLERGGGKLPGKINDPQKVPKHLKNLCASTESVETATR